MHDGFGPYTGSMSALNQEMLVMFRLHWPTVFVYGHMAEDLGLKEWSYLRGEAALDPAGRRVAAFSWE